jgi:hypothetical protein
MSMLCFLSYDMHCMYNGTPNGIALIVTLQIRTALPINAGYISLCSFPQLSPFHHITISLSIFISLPIYFPRHLHLPHHLFLLQLQKTKIIQKGEMQRTIRCILIIDPEIA